MGLVVPPSTINITVYQGASLKQQFQWKYGLTAEDALPVDLSLAVARMQIRKAFSSETPYLSVSSETSDIVMDVDGNIVLNIKGEDTADIPSGSAFWDLEIEWPDGDICRLLMGKVTVSPEVTK